MKNKTISIELHLEHSLSADALADALQLAHQAACRALLMYPGSDGQYIRVADAALPDA